MPRNNVHVATCVIPGCERPYSARGWCVTHYQRWVHRGDPLYLAPTVEERFWQKVDKSGECWIWTSNRGLKGYGQVTINNRPRTATRVAWEFTYGAIPDGMWVLHRCDIPACVRPDHLFLGTSDDNIRDMIAKGRAWWQVRQTTPAG